MIIEFTGQPVDAPTAAKIQSLLAGMSDPLLKKNFRKIELRVHPPRENDTAVEHIHVTWNEEHLPKVASPEGFSRLANGTLCPKGSSLVEVSYISRFSGGMGSYYQFDGCFLSVVVSFDFSAILDARIEKAC